MYLNTEAEKKNTYGAIVVGTGISGGWAAKELCEKGVNTLVLERGRMIRHVEDYPTAMKNPWELPHADRLTREEHKDYEKQTRTGYTVKPSTKHWWVKDTEEPYTEVKRFDWMRGYHVGGRSIMWGRQSYRWSPMDFESNAKDGHGVDWPIRYEDLASWYDYVESYIGVSGQNEGLAQLPDGKFLPPMDLNCVELEVKKVLKSKFNRVLTIGRTAHLTAPLPGSGRGTCQYRDLCIRGCPYGGYFSSNASTLPAAERTGKMTLRPNSIVTEIIYDEKKGRATGVRVLDVEKGTTEDFFARIIFLNASTVGSTFIMLNSVSNRFPNGFGNDSGELGHNLMDHHLNVGAAGEYEGFEDMYYSGRRANGFYVPRYRNLDPKEKRDYLRGFGYQGRASRHNWMDAVKEMSIGVQLKEAVTEPGGWRMGMGGFGEMLPHHDNKLYINKDLKDKHGLPTVTFDCEFRENELKMRKDMAADAAEMLEAAGFKNVKPYDNTAAPGLGIHEMGTARMGKDPRTSVLNKWNQVHACRNVFVTDGSCMTSSACQNPSLTYMALTARAVNFACDEMKKNNL